MKKNLILGAVLLAALAFGSNAMAATVNNEGSGAGAGKSISLESGALNLNFSPGVFGQYTTATAGGNEQWYSIGTYHGGGDTFFATSQQQTVMWKKVRADTTKKFSDAAIPATKALSESETQWTSGSWVKGG